MLFRRNFLAHARCRTLSFPQMSLASIRAAMATITYSPPTVRIGKEAPSVSSSAVIDGKIESFDMKNSRGQYVVLLFYPKDFTFVCPTEIIAFSDRMADFKKLNTSVVAISTDTEFSHLAWVQTPRSKGGLGFMQIPIVADTTKSISADYGVLQEELGIALRGLFIIDPDGITQQITVNNFPIGRSVDETVRLLQAIQFNKKHGEVCPANWKPGAATIVPSVTGSQKYFEKAEEVRHVAHSNMETHLATTADVKKFISSNQSVVVEFMADWCGKCKQLEPFVDSLIASNPATKFAIVNTGLNEGEAIQKAFGVEVLPHFKFFKGGKEIGEAVGYKKKIVTDLIEKLK